jgi:hypothetical protein
LFRRNIKEGRGSEPLAMRKPGESNSDVILRLVEMDAGRR